MNNKKVCIIDDDENIIEVYGVKLKNAGFEIVSASDGNEGIELIKKEKPDLILLDIMMPQKNGVEVLADLEKDLTISKTPVIILSNVSDDETATKVGEFSTHFYVVKALTSPDKIFGLVREVLH